MPDASDSRPARRAGRFPGLPPAGHAGAVLLAAAVLLGPRAAAAQQRFTLVQILSDPMPTELVASPDGRAVAWVQDAEGRRNVWVAAAPDFQGRQVTRYDRDDGQEIDGLGFTPDGARLVYVRGGAPNGAGEIPNPTSDVDGAGRAIWVVAVAGGEPRKLDDGAAPAVSPKGDLVAYVKHGQLWSASLGEKPEPKQLAHTRGGASSLVWSPDGSRLAFTSHRKAHSFIGIRASGAGTITYMAPTVDASMQPAWSPDGSRIAWLSIPSTHREIPFIPYRVDLPWSIRVGDPATGEARTIWTADAGMGSVFHGYAGEAQLMWGAGERLVFPWEKDGWLHLWSVPAAGGDATLLTPGEFEVQYVAMGAGGREVLFDSNQGDVDRRHLWRVSVSGGPPREITPGTGIEWAPVAVLDGKGLAFLASDATHPAHAVVKLGADEPRWMAAASLPKDFPAPSALVTPQQVIFSAADGMRIHGQLFLPKDAARGGKHAAVLFFHGGSRRQMLLGFHHMRYYHNAYAMNQYLASRGYVVLSVNYRTGIGYGERFREAENSGADGASEFNDVMGAGVYLRSRPDVDPERIGVWGGSYGGYLTAMALARASDLFKAGVDLHGVHDWNPVIRNFMPSYDSTITPAIANRAYASSPAADVASWRSPVLLIQGDDDRNVPFTESIDIAEPLRREGVHVEQLIFPDEVHDFLLHRNFLAAYRAAADFFDRMLKRGESRAAGR